MPIKEWHHRGQLKLTLSRTWPDGTRFRRFMSNRTVARELETRINYAILTGNWPQLKEELARGPEARDTSSNPTIHVFSDEYLQYCKVNNRRPDFKVQVLTSIKRIVGDVRLKDFKRRQADHFKELRLAEGVGPATINRGLSVLRHMFSVAVDREYLQVNPLTKYRLLKEVEEPLRIMTYEEYRSLIEAVAREDQVIGAYTAILGETGMRKSEGLRLQWDHIRRQERIALIGRAKSGKMRSVRLSDLALRWLDGLVRYMDIPYVFVDAGRRTVWKDPRGPFLAGRLAAGLDWVGFHDLRHFRATQWLMNGVDVNSVKEFLGHSNIQTTMRYVHYVETYATKTVIAAQEKEQAEWLDSTASTGYKVDTAKQLR